MTSQPSVTQLLKDKAIVSVDIGGGLDPQPKFIILDERELPTVDILWELEKLPYPFADNSVDFIKCANVLQRISREKKGLIRYMDEMWRILKPECQITIATPYGGSYEYFRDPCAVNLINEATFAYFDPLEPLTNGGFYRIYKPKPWKIVTQLWNTLGMIEVLLEKRREDVSYVK